MYPVLKFLLLPILLRKIKRIEGAEYLPKTGGWILASNHVDWLDGFYLGAAVTKAIGRPVIFLTASNNYGWTGLAIQIPENAGDIVEYAAERVRRGSIVGNFPEGQRNSQTALLNGKTGTIRMAALTNAPIIPIGLRADAGRTMGESIRFLLSGQHPVSIHFGPPIRPTLPPEGVSKEWLEAETKQLLFQIGQLAGKQVP